MPVNQVASYKDGDGSTGTLARPTSGTDAGCLALVLHATENPVDVMAAMPEFTPYSDGHAGVALWSGSSGPVTWTEPAGVGAHLVTFVSFLGFASDVANVPALSDAVVLTDDGTQWSDGQTVTQNTFFVFHIQHLSGQTLSNIAVYSGSPGDLHSTSGSYTVPTSTSGTIGHTTVLCSLSATTGSPTAAAIRFTLSTGSRDDVTVTQYKLPTLNVTSATFNWTGSSFNQRVQVFDGLNVAASFEIAGAKEVTFPNGDYADLPVYFEVQQHDWLFQEYESGSTDKGIVVGELRDDPLKVHVPTWDYV